MNITEIAKKIGKGAPQKKIHVSRHRHLHHQKKTIAAFGMFWEANYAGPAMNELYWRPGRKEQNRCEHWEGAFTPPLYIDTENINRYTDNTSRLQL